MGHFLIVTWAVLCVFLSSARSAPQTADIYSLPGTQVRRWQGFPPITNYHGHRHQPIPPTVVIRKPPVYTYPTYDTRGYEDYDYNGVQYVPLDIKPMEVINVTKERMGGFGGTGDTKGYGAFEYKKSNEEEVKEYQDIAVNPTQFTAADAKGFKDNPYNNKNYNDELLDYPNTNNGAYEYSNANDKSYEYKDLREPVRGYDRYQVTKNEGDSYPPYSGDVYYDDEKGDRQKYKKIYSEFYPTNTESEEPYGYKISNGRDSRKFNGARPKKYKRRGSQKYKKNVKYADVIVPEVPYRHEDFPDDSSSSKYGGYKNLDDVYRNYKKKEESSKKYKNADDPFFSFMKDDGTRFTMGDEEFFGTQERDKGGFDQVTDVSLDAMMEDFFRLPKRKEDKILPLPRV